MRGYINWVGGSLLFALIVIQYSTCNNYRHTAQEQSSLIEASKDTIKYYVDKDGRNSAQIALLEGSKQNLLQILNQKDLQLTALLKKGARSGVVVNTVTKFDTIMTIKRDTIDGVQLYENTIANNWYSLNVRVKDDSLRASVEMRDSLVFHFKWLSRVS